MLSEKNVVQVFLFFVGNVNTETLFFAILTIVTNAVCKLNKRFFLTGTPAIVHNIVKEKMLCLMKNFLKDLKI